MILNIVKDLADLKLQLKRFVGYGINTIERLAYQAVGDLHGLVVRLADQVHAQIAAHSSLVADYKTVAADYGTRLIALEAQVTALNQAAAYQFSAKTWKAPRVEFADGTLVDAAFHAGLSDAGTAAVATTNSRLIPADPLAKTPA